MNRKDHIKRIILCTINDYDPAPWHTIRDAVAEQYTIGDWLLVRDLMQEMINDGIIRRVESIHVEAYTR